MNKVNRCSKKYLFSQRARPSRRERYERIFWANYGRTSPRSTVLAFSVWPISILVSLLLVYNSPISVLGMLRGIESNLTFPSAISIAFPIDRVNNTNSVGDESLCQTTAGEWNMCLIQVCRLRSKSALGFSVLNGGEVYCIALYFFYACTHTKWQ